MKKLKTIQNINSIKKFRFPTFNDGRGSFSKLFSKKKLKIHKVNFNIKQINFSSNKKRGTLRGMHFQDKPMNDYKIVICLEGQIYDVIVNLKKSSKYYLKHYVFTLDGKKKDCLFIPKGYAHGYQTLTSNTKLLYIHSEEYYKKYDKGINPFDEIINIRWPIKVTSISIKDKNFRKIDKKFKGL